MNRSWKLFVAISMLAVSIAGGAVAAVTVDPPHFPEPARQGDPSAANSCATCHTGHITLGSTGYNNICQNCHRPGDPAGGVRPLTLADEANPFGTHSSTGVVKQYQTSHRWSGSDMVPRAGAQPPLQAAMTSGSLRGRAGGELACVRCHNQHSNANGSFLRVANDRDQLCLDCHRSRNVGSHLQGSHPVNIDYNAAAGSFSRPPQNANPANGSSDLGAQLVKTGNVLVCSTCHGVHFSDSRSSTADGAAQFASLSSGDGYLLRTDRRGAAVAAGEADTTNICTNCHTGKKSHNMKGQDVQCSDCHGAHVEYDPQDPAGSQGTNIYLVRRAMEKGSKGRVLFRYTGSRREYKNAGGTGVCQGCHAVPAPGGTYPSEHDSNDPKVCSVCHYHNSSNGSFSGACTSCHGYPPSQPALGGPSGLATPATGATALDPGAHVTHAKGRFMACNTCHSGYATKAMPSNSIDIGFSINGSNFPGFGGSVQGGTFNATNLNSGYSWSRAAGTGGTNGNAAITCSVYCHGSTLTGGSVASPAWTVSNGTQKACGACHGVTAATAPVTGSHQRHAGNTAGGLALACESCHGTHGDNSHVNGSVEWDLGQLKGLTGNALYQGQQAGATGNLAPSGTYGQCTNISCHSNGNGGTPLQLPTWGGSPVANCLGCHGNDADSGTPVTSGAHLAHINNPNVLGAGNNFTCGECHAKTVSTGNNRVVVMAANHVNTIKDYSGARAGGSASYNTSTKSCSASYCHSNGAGTQVAPPAWNSGTGLTCKGCHGSNGTSVNGEPDYATTPSTPNSHQKHVAAIGITDTTRCANCHVRTVDQQAASKLKDYSGAVVHLNRTRDVAFRKIGTATGRFNADGTCSSTYCHGTSSPAWGAADAMNCASCHSAGNSAASPLQGAHHIHYSSSLVPAAFTNSSGNISSRSAYRFACSTCHASGANRTIHADGPANRYGVAQVFFGMTSPGHAPTYNYSSAVRGTDRGSFTWTAGGSKSCNSTYCHSDGNGGTGAKTVRWDGSATGSCSACHGSQATIASGAHQAHVNSSAAIGGLNFGCVDCHALTVSDNSTISDRSRHVNKLKDYSGARAGGSASYNASTKSCSASYCHSNGVGSQVAPPAWNSGAGLSCKGCHGAVSSAAGEPDYANSASTPNSHQTHVRARNILETTGCAVCHRATVDAGSANRLAAGSPLHLNRRPDVAFSPFANLSGSFNPAARSCSATYCHANSSPVWGGPSLSCGQCHATRGLAGSHAIHYDSTATPNRYLNYSGNVSSATNYRFSCSSCHNGVHADGPFNAAAGQIADVQFGYTSAGRRGTYQAGMSFVIDPATTFTWTNGSCSATYCHSDGRGGNAPAPVSWSTTTSSGSCVSCHGDASTLSSGAHARHVNPTTGKGIGCVECHARTVSGNTVVSDKSKHINKVRDVAFVSGGANFNSGSCSATYCHSNGIGVSVAVAWVAGGASCGSCHGVTSATLGGIHFKHLSSAYGPRLAGTAPYVTLCSNCHTYTGELGATHVNGVIANDLATGNCTTSCHRNEPAVALIAQPPTRRACASCHDGNVSYDARFGNISAPRKGMGIFTSAGHGTLKLAGAAMTCSDCHDPDGRHINGVRGDRRLLAVLGDGTNNASCGYCHNDSGKVATASFRGMSSHLTARSSDGKPRSLCNSCHDPHGTTNAAMIRLRFDVVTGNGRGAAVKTVLFSNISTGFVNASRTGICQVCHTNTKYYRNYTSPNGVYAGDVLYQGSWGHMGGNRHCLTCHDHKSSKFAFYPSAGPCDSCHGYPPRVGDGKGSPAASSDVHGKHNMSSKAVTDGLTGAASGMACSRCHSGHGINPVSNSVVIPDYIFNGSQATSYGLNSCSNISCHFKSTPTWK